MDLASGSHAHSLSPPPPQPADVSPRRMGSAGNGVLGQHHCLLETELEKCLEIINTQLSSRETEPTLEWESLFVGVEQSFQHVSGFLFVLFRTVFIVCLPLCFTKPQGIRKQQMIKAIYLLYLKAGKPDGVN